MLSWHRIFHMSVTPFICTGLQGVYTSVKQAFTRFRTINVWSVNESYKAMSSMWQLQCKWSLFFLLFFFSPHKAGKSIPIGSCVTGWQINAFTWVGGWEINVIAEPCMKFGEIYTLTSPAWDSLRSWETSAFTGLQERTEISAFSFFAGSQLLCLFGSVSSNWGCKGVWWENKWDEINSNDKWLKCNKTW